MVLIGGSYIGCEVAASLASQGRNCTIVMQEGDDARAPVRRRGRGLLPAGAEEHGVEVHGGDELERFEGSGGRVGKVVTAGGLSLDCDMVVIGAGVMPDVMLARGGRAWSSGEAGGVKCSSRLETSVPGIYAAGDICEYDSVIHGRHLRVEHWDVAFNQGKTAALNMLGRDVPHDAVPYFFSDLADWASMEYVGPGSGEPVVRGSLDDGDFTAFYVDAGTVTAALTVGRSDDLEHARRVDRRGRVGRLRSGWRTSRQTWLSSRQALSFSIPLGGRLMAGRLVLVQVIGVRVPVPRSRTELPAAARITSAHVGE